MKIGLNLLHARCSIGGGWNYIANVLKMLGEHDGQNEYVAYCNRESEGLISGYPRIRVVRVGLEGSDKFRRVVYENSLLLARARCDGIETLHWFGHTLSIWCGIKSVVTIYDLKMFDEPDGYDLVRGVYFRTMVRWAVNHATVLAAMSKTTAAALASHFGVCADRVVVVPNPVDRAFAPASAGAVREFREKYRLPNAFWLYVAHYYPHKNHIRLFQAYQRVRRELRNEWPLVLRCDRNGADERLGQVVRDLGIENHVVWLPRLDPSEMVTLYSAASALVFPSLYEGGGIPVVEAMSCGCPVVASDIETTREFAGDAALTFDATSVESISAAMLQFGKNLDLRDICSAKGLSRSSAYRSEEVFGCLMESYRLAARQ